MPPTSRQGEAPTGALPSSPVPESTNPPSATRVADGDVPVGVAVSAEPGKAGTVTARKAGGLRDMGLVVDPRKVGVKAALQHLAKAVNIAFQTDYGENYLESVYQAAIVRRGEVNIVHREYFGFGDSWFGEFGRLIRSLRADARRPRPRLARGPEADRREGAELDPGHPQPDRPQARHRRRIRGPRPGLRRADLRPPRSVGHHHRLEPQRLEHPDHDRGARHPDLAARE